MPRRVPPLTTRLSTFDKLFSRSLVYLKDRSSKDASRSENQACTSAVIDHDQHIHSHPGVILLNSYIYLLPRSKRHPSDSFSTRMSDVMDVSILPLPTRIQLLMDAVSTPVFTLVVPRGGLGS
jgi:hypothetical protein